MNQKKKLENKDQIIDEIEKKLNKFMFFFEI